MARLCQNRWTMTFFWGGGHSSQTVPASAKVHHAHIDAVGQAIVRRWSRYDRLINELATGRRRGKNRLKVLLGGSNPQTLYELPETPRYHQ